MMPAIISTLLTTWVKMVHGRSMCVCVCGCERKPHHVTPNGSTSPERAQMGARSQVDGPHQKPADAQNPSPGEGRAPRVRCHLSRPPEEQHARLRPQHERGCRYTPKTPHMTVQTSRVGELT